MAEKRQITLGEVQMVVGKAVERVKGLTKFYRRARQEFAEKWYAIVDANVATSKTITLFKTSYKGNVFPKTVSRKDWKSQAGYKVKVTSTSEQEEEKTTGIQKLIAIKQQFPDNLPLQKILQKRLLEIGDLTPEEIKEAQAFEDQKIKQMAAAPIAPPISTPTAIPKRGKLPREALELQRSTRELRELTPAI